MDSQGKKKQIKGYNSFSYEKFSIILIWIGVAFVGLIFLVFFVDTAVYKFISSEVDSRLGNFGQLTEGLVGSLWALAGIILVYETLKLQRNELRLQRKDLEFQSKEIIKQTEQLSRQNKTLETQTFENTVFHLMSLHNEILESIAFKITIIDDSGNKVKKNIHGRESFVEFYTIYKRYFNASFEDNPNFDIDTTAIQTMINSSYHQFYEENQLHLGHYFRNLFIILKFVDKLVGEEKIFYLDLIRAQLSNYELLLLFFHCLSDIDVKFKPLTEKYALFRNLPDDELITLTKELYDPKAYL
jgi:hypothetical protein